MPGLTKKQIELELIELAKRAPEYTDMYGDLGLERGDIAELLKKIQGSRYADSQFDPPPRPKRKPGRPKGSKKRDEFNKFFEDAGKAISQQIAKKLSQPSPWFTWIETQEFPDGTGFKP